MTTQELIKIGLFCVLFVKFFDDTGEKSELFMMKGEKSELFCTLGAQNRIFLTGHIK